MRPIIFCLFFILSLNNLYSQPDARRLITKEWEVDTEVLFNAYKTDVCTDSKACLYKIEVVDHVMHPSEFTLRLLKLDKNGNELWRKKWTNRWSFEPGSSDYPEWDIEADPFDNIFIFKFDTLFKFNSEGEYLWQLPIQDEFTYINFKNDFIVFDSKGNFFLINKLSYESNDLYITKYNNNGSLQWEIYLENFLFEQVQLGINSDDDCLLYCKKKNGDFEVIKYSGENGDHISTKTLPDFSATIFSDNDDNLYYFTFQYPSESLKKFSNNCDQLFEYTFNSEYKPGHSSNLFRWNRKDDQICFDERNSSYTCGFIDSDISGKEYDMSFILKLDKDGNEKWAYVDTLPFNEIYSQIQFCAPNIIYVSGYRWKDSNNRKFYYPPFTAKFLVSEIAYDLSDSSGSNPIDTLNMGRLCLGETGTKYITIRNYSDYDIKLNDPDFEDSEQFSAEYLRGNTLHWNDTLGLNISLTPDSPGLIETMMYIICEQDETIIDSLMIIAEVVESKITVSNDIDFGYVKTGQKPEKDFTIFNTGMTDIYINGLEKFDPPFVLKATKPEIPASLLPGDSMMVTITLDIGEEEEYFDTLSIQTLKIDEACPATGFVNLHVLGLKYDLKANDIDFQSIPSCRTKLDTVVVVNYASKVITLLDNGVLSNESDFDLVSGADAGTKLNLLDTARYIISFNPTPPDGLKTGELRIKTDNTDIEFVSSSLTGESESVNLSVSDIHFGDIAINTDSTLKCILVNNNSFDIKISAIEENGDWIDIQPQSFIIPAGQDFEIEVKINLDEAKAHTISPRIIVEAPCPDTVQFNIDASGIKSSLELTSLCNFGKAEFCKTQTMDIEIKNTGNLPVTLISGGISGPDKELFTFAEIYENIKIDPDSSFIEKIIFSPGNVEIGMKSAIVKNKLLVDNSEQEFITDLTGEKITIEYNIPKSVSLLSEINETGNSQIVIENTGMNNITIEEIYLKDGTGFLISPDLTGETILPGSSKTINISLFSAFAGTYNDEIFIKFSGPDCEYRDTIKTVGVVKQDILISFHDTIGVIGDMNFRIPLYLKSNSNRNT